MKYFLLLLISLPALACKPAPVPSCEGEKSIMLKTEVLKQLTEKVAEFQKLLDGAVLSGADSCFNNHFASFYLGGLKEPFTCRKQLEKVEQATTALLNPDSAEWKNLKHPEEDKPKLAALAADTKSILKYFLKEHAD